jgi:ribosome-binding ATPase YchF (GTP1/OBG family)
MLAIVQAEARAWVIPDGFTAPMAAGIIHSDLQRGFIAAEVSEGYDGIVKKYCNCLNVSCLVCILFFFKFFWNPFLEFGF